MREYATLDHLHVRIHTHDLYSERPSDVNALVWNAISPHLGASLLDVGCGTGSFLQYVRERLPEARCVGADTSPAALEATKGPGIDAIHADIQNLPFSDGEFSATTARHMLYHVSDPLAGLHECARVTAAGGVVAVTINGAEQLPRINDTVREAYEEALGVPATPSATQGGFSVDALSLPPLMHEVFAHVEVHHDHNALLFHEPEPVARYAISLLGLFNLHPDDVRHLLVSERIRQRVDNWFATSDVPWRDPKSVVVAVGRTQRL